MSTASMVPNIDFLPAEYRENRVRRNAEPWRLIVSLAMVVLVGATAFAQYQRRQRLMAALEALEVPYEVAMRQNSRLGELQSELAAAQAEAELLTYLRHPWPRTQILDALLVPLPEEVILEELQIHAESIRPQGHRGRGREGEKSDEESLKKLPPAARDLKQLRKECDAQQTVVLFNGWTTETAALHRYLGELAKVPLFAKAELASIEADPGDLARRLRFSAMLLLRPGYGQSGGPTPESMSPNREAGPSFAGGVLRDVSEKSPLPLGEG